MALPWRGQRKVGDQIPQLSFLLDPRSREVAIQRVLGFGRGGKGSTPTSRGGRVPPERAVPFFMSSKARRARSLVDPSGIDWGKAAPCP
jgi:hypothetical protein